MLPPASTAPRRAVGAPRERRGGPFFFCPCCQVASFDVNRVSQFTTKHPLYGAILFSSLFFL